MNLLTLAKRAVDGNVLGARTGLTAVNMNAGGVYPGMYIGIASEQKVGKSTFVLEYFVTSLLELNPDIEFDFNILSTEMPVVDLEAKMVSRYIFKKYNIALSSNYILGKKLNPDGSRVKLTKEHFNIVQKVITEYTQPIVGEFSEDGKLLHPGRINWLNKENPTGVRRQLIKYAENNGEVIKQPVQITMDDGTLKGVEKMIGYKPNKPNKIVINVVDHVRQLPKERGFSMKENVDKMSSYFVETSNIFGFVNIAVIHLNRWASQEAVKFYGDKLIPTADAIKDTGNIGEDVSLLITLMDPSDPAYKLNRHLGYDFVTWNKENEAKYRSAHIVENRYGLTANMRLGFQGEVNHFFEIK